MDINKVFDNGPHLKILNVLVHNGVEKTLTFWIGSIL